MTVAIPPDELSRLLAQDRFLAAVNSTFELPATDTMPAISLRLIEVTVRNAPKGYEQFAALFEGPAEPVLPQGTYEMTHPAFGTMPLFMVPVGHSAERTSYEVCVIRNVEAPSSNAP
jgi:hypothetical protein